MIPAPAFLANPERFMAFSRWAAPLLGVIAVALAAAGLWLGFSAPEDYQQGDTVRIMFIHVPAAWMSLFVYVCLGIASLLALVFRHVLADAAAQAAAPLGAGFTFLALVTGSLWGRPMWGAWWVWDARLTSVLVLFLFYLAYIALRASLDDEAKAARASAIRRWWGWSTCLSSTGASPGGTACTRAPRCCAAADPPCRRSIWRRCC
jgi:heme exporter protein C